MKKIERATVHFQQVERDTGENVGPSYTKVQNVYRDGVVSVVRQNGRLHEAWHCPTDKVWKCHISVTPVPVLSFTQLIQELGV